MFLFIFVPPTPTHRGAHKGVAPVGQSPIPLCCKMSSNERVIVTPSVLDILEHGTMRWLRDSRSHYRKGIKRELATV